MEENTNKPNNPNPSNKKPGKKPYYKKRYNPQPRKRKFWNADKIVGLSAMSIALFTLVVLIYQSRILEQQYDLTVKQQKASVLPYLLFADGFSDESYHIILQNKGLGPAFIKGLYVKEGDSTFLIHNLGKYYFDNSKNDTDSLISYNTHGLISGVVLAPGDQIELFASEGSKEAIEPVKQYLGNHFYGNGPNTFIIEYESVFEDAWVVESSFKTFTKEEYGEINAINKIHTKIN